MKDLSSGIMTASTGDDNSTKELKGFVVVCCLLLFHIFPLLTSGGKLLMQAMMDQTYSLADIFPM